MGHACSHCPRSSLTAPGPAGALRGSTQFLQEEPCSYPQTRLTTSPCGTQSWGAGAWAGADGRREPPTASHTCMPRPRSPGVACVSCWVPSSRRWTPRAGLHLIRPLEWDLRLSLCPAWRPSASAEVTVHAGLTQGSILWSVTHRSSRACVQRPDPAGRTQRSERHSQGGRRAWPGAGGGQRAAGSGRHVSEPGLASGCPLANERLAWWPSARGPPSPRELGRAIL